MRPFLQILCFLPLLIGYWWVHYDLAMWVSWIPDLFTTRPMRLSGLLLGTVVCGSLAGLIFAIPTGLIYKQHPIIFAAGISLIATSFDAFHGRFWGNLLFTNIALVLDLIFLAISLPLCVWAFMRLRPNNSFKPRPLRGLGKVP